MKLGREVDKASLVRLKPCRSLGGVEMMNSMLARRIDRTYRTIGLYFRRSSCRDLPGLVEVLARDLFCLWFATVVRCFSDCT